MVFTFNLPFWLLLQVLVLPILLPMLVGLVTTRITSARTRAILLLALSVATAFLSALLNAYQSGVTEFDLGGALVLALVTFVGGVGVHFGLLKPTGVSDRLISTGRTSGVDGLLPPT